MKAKQLIGNKATQLQRGRLRLKMHETHLQTMTQNTEKVFVNSLKIDARMH